MVSLESFDNGNVNDVVEQNKFNNGDKMENNNCNICRSEVMFLYDVQDGNPNGDPLNGNKPRMDENSKINIVSDVRLKRTIRDYLSDYQGYDIFIRETEYVNGDDVFIKDAKRRAIDYSSTGGKYKSLSDGCKDLRKNILDECIDVRLFGATIPLELDTGKKKKEKSGIDLTGPVQFKNARSLNKVNPISIKGTGAFASGDNKTTSTFREEYNLPYSLINFYGIINENAAVDTNLSNRDIDVLMDAIWNGTKNLITRSKIGQIPRVLLQIEYCEDYYHIGDLNNMISLDITDSDCKVSEDIRNITEFTLDCNLLINVLLENKDKIKCVHYKVDNMVTFKDFGHFSYVIKHLEDNGVLCSEFDCIH